jgi:hypothetical protein
MITFVDLSCGLVGKAAKCSLVILAVAYNEINADSLQYYKQKEIKVTAYEQKDVAHLWNSLVSGLRLK